MNIGDKVKEAREERNMSQYRLAKITGISSSYISELENGKYRNPSAEVLMKLSRALGISVSKLLSKAS